MTDIAASQNYNQTLETLLAEIKKTDSLLERYLVDRSVFPDGFIMALETIGKEQTLKNFMHNFNLEDFDVSDYIDQAAEITVVSEDTIDLIQLQKNWAFVMFSLGREMKNIKGNLNVIDSYSNLSKGVQGIKLYQDANSEYNDLVLLFNHLQKQASLVESLINNSRHLQNVQSPKPDKIKAELYFSHISAFKRWLNGSSELEKLITKTRSQMQEVADRRASKELKVALSEALDRLEVIKRLHDMDYQDLNQVIELAENVCNGYSEPFNLYFYLKSIDFDRFYDFTKVKANQLSLYSLKPINRELEIAEEENKGGYQNELEGLKKSIDDLTKSIEALSNHIALIKASFRQLVLLHSR